MARFSRQTRRRTATSLGGCVRGKVWQDMRFTPKAERALESVPREEFEGFMVEHWERLPRVLRAGVRHQSNLNMGKRRFLCVFTFCDEGIVKGLLCTPEEAARIEEIVH